MAKYLISWNLIAILDLKKEFSHERMFALPG